MTVVWLTGRSGAGKSTIAGRLETVLDDRGERVIILDGDDVRTGLCSDLGFSDEDRDENIRRIAEAAKLMARTGAIVIVSAISPFQAGRDAARALFDRGEFFEVYVDTSAAEAERRDPKGLYKRARLGEIPQFTGIDSAYQAPREPEVHIRTIECPPDECAQQVLDVLDRAGRLVA